MTRASNSPTTARLRSAWAAEMSAAKTARSTGDRADEWSHLERAHVLSQPLAGRHVRTHLAMLAFGARHRDGREVAGQVARTMVAALGSWTGRYPTGNTGGARVSAFAVMPMPDDLRPFLATATTKERS